MPATATTAARRIKVLLVDDSASVRVALTEILNADPGIEVIGTATDPFMAAQRIRAQVPDVIFLDIEMPRMDGLTFLRKLMSQHPIPTIICSTIAQHGSDTYLAALEAGAVEVVPKPEAMVGKKLAESADLICRAVRAAASARVKGRAPMMAAAPTEAKLDADAVLPLGRKHAPPVPPTQPIVCIGSSTGGTEALREVLTALPPTAPGIVIVQHMPGTFTSAFARRLDGLCAVAVSEARNGDAVEPGRVLIARGGEHLGIVRRGDGYRIKLIGGPPVSRHKPSVDVLFRSAATQAGANALGILLTGMGDDGARGLLEMRQAGAHTIAQDEASSIVWGMPKEAIDRGAAAQVLPLSRMAREIIALSALARAKAAS